MTKHVFIPKGDEMVEYSKEYGTPLQHTFVSLDWKGVIDHDIPLGGQYDEVIVYDRQHGYKVVINKL